MTWQVQWTKQALRSASRLDRPTRQRIAEAIQDFSATGRGDVKRLRGKHQGLFRLRVGGWRILCSQEDDEILLIRAVHPRGDAY